MNQKMNMVSLSKSNIALLFFVFFLAVYFYINVHQQETLQTEPLFTIREESGNILIYFCPQDDCEEQLFNLMKGANDSIYCALYDIKLDSFVESIVAQKSRGIDIKIITEDNTAKNAKSKYDELKEILKENITTDEKRSSGKYNNLMHNKFCIIDKKIVFTGSFNPTHNGAHKNNNNMLVIHSEYLAQNYLDEFKEMQNNEFGDSNSNTVEYPVLKLDTQYGKVNIGNYFCPEDDCQKQVIDILNNANKSIYFCMFSFTSNDTKEALIDAAERGVRIYGIFDKTQGGSRYSVFEDLKNQNNSNIDILKDSNPAFLHHKYFVIDNYITITGSMNPTMSGYFYNDENIIVIDNQKIAELYLREYDNRRKD